MEKRNKIIFWSATSLLSLMMCMSAGMYFFNTEQVTIAFESLGYPTYLIYPLAIAKILAVIAITTRKSATIAEWAYAGLFFDFVLAATGHLYVGDGEAGGAIVALILLTVSYIFSKKI